MITIDIPEKMKAYIRYDPLTGLLYWITTHPRFKSKVGLIDGTFDKQGYRLINFMGTMYKYHRVAYYLYYKIQPNIIDHIDGNVANNNIDNLSNTTISGNGRNKKMHRSGAIPGVRFNNKANKWVAYTTRSPKQIHLGSFSTKEQALDAVNNYKKNYLKGII